jgi:plasmid stabilization system protein ParE
MWYEQKSAGLGHDFIRCVEARFGQIVSSPQLFRLRHGLSRLAATARFPYAIYFIWDESRQVVSVLRVLHFKQDSRPYI